MDKMLPSLKKVGTDNNQVFNYMKVKDKHFYPLWHYHPQCEIMIIEKSSGTSYIGDNIDTFKEGDVLLFGPDIPHLLRNHSEYFNTKEKTNNTRKKAEATVLYFSQHFAGEEFLDLQEMASIKELIQTARRGIVFHADSAKQVTKKLYSTIKKEGLARLLDFISVLHFMATQTEHRTLSSIGFMSNFDDEDVDRLNKVTDYLMNNFSNNIKLDEVATIANMSPTAFCRYFKARTNKTFITFLNEIRVGHACRLLIENRSMTVSQICFDSGFNNLTNFNIQFKKLKGKSPLDYRNSYQK